MANKQKVGGNARKKGRMLAWCASYRNQERAEKSKARRLIRHLWRCPWDGVARAAFDRIPATARKGLTLPPLAHSPSDERKRLGITLTETKHRAALGLPVAA